MQSRPLRWTHAFSQGYKARVPLYSVSERQQAISIVPLATRTILVIMQPSVLREREKQAAVGLTATLENGDCCSFCFFLGPSAPRSFALFL